MLFSMGGKNKRISDKNKEEMSGGFHLFCCQAILLRLFKIKYRQVSFSPKNIQIHRRHTAFLCVPAPADGCSENRFLPHHLSASLLICGKKIT
jgi:hypothetical protein